MAERIRHLKMCQNRMQRLAGQWPLRIYGYILFYFAKNVTMYNCYQGKRVVGNLLNGVCEKIIN